MICPDLSVLEARPWLVDTRTHVADCGSCRLVMELIDERSQAAESRDRRAECVRFEALIAVRIAGGLRGPAAAMLDEHVRGCADCHAIAETLAPSSDVASDHSTLPAIESSSYALGAEVARGGMGRIVSARDLRIGRPVAVKELLAKTATQAARFEREARVTARLQHPGIIPIYEIGRWESGTPFYAMRMVAGRTLRSALTNKSLEARLALLPSVIAAAEAVAFAHAHDVIHRDLTPANIMVGDYGETVVIDWGLAKDVAEPDDVDAGPYRREPESSAELTAAGAIIGTAAYMPPEQARGERVDARADVYALGAILYHLLSGQAPFKGSSDDVLRRVKSEAPAPLPANAPRDLASIAAKAMAKSPDDRYPSAKELAAELTAFQAGRLVASHEYTRGDLIRRWMRKRRGILAVVAIAAVALGVFAVFAVQRIVDERDVADEQRIVAEHRRSQSEALSVTLLAEQGRAELLAGQSARALPYLSAAYSHGDTSAETRFMIASAMHDIDARERVFAGAPREPAGLAFSPDGEQVLAIKADTIETWRIETGAAGPTLQADAGVVLTEAVFSPDGKTIVAHAGDQENRWPAIFVFDVATGGVRKLTGHTKSSARPLFTPDGKSVITVSWDGTWRRWDLATGEARVVNMSGPPRYGRFGPVGAGAPRLDASGERLLTMNWEGRLELWSVATGARLWELATQPTYFVSLHPDGTRVLTCNLDEAILWDIPTSKIIARKRGPSFHLVSCSFRGDGKAIELAGDRGGVAVWDDRLERDLATLTDRPGLLQPVFAGSNRLVVPNEFGGGGLTVWDPGLEVRAAHIDEVSKYSVASTDGRRIATSRPDGRVEVWRIDRGQLHRRFVTDDVKNVNVSLDGSRVVATSKTGAVRIHDVDRAVVLPTPSLREPIDVAGGRVGATSPEGDVVVVDATGAVVGRFTPPAPATGVELTEDGTRVLVSHAKGSELRDAASGRVLATIPIAGKLAHVSGDGSRVIVVTRGAVKWDGGGNDSEHVVVWDLRRGAEVVRIPLDGPPLFDLAFISRDGRRIGLPYRKTGATVKDEVLVFALFDADSGRKLASVPNAVFPSFAAATDRVFVSGVDGVLHVLRYADGSVLARLPIVSRFGVVQVTADGTRLAVVSTDGTCEIRSAVDARPLYRFAMRPTVPSVDVKSRNFGYELTIANGFNGIRDDLFVAGNENGSAIATWDIHLETRSPPEIAKLVDERVPWRLEGGRLVRRDL